MTPQISLSIKGIPIRLLLLFFLFLSFVPHGSAAETVNMINAIGTGQIPQGNVASGRQQAVSNGLVSVIYQAVASLLTPEALNNNFETLAQSLYSQPNQFIQDFKVQVETSKAGTYHVVVEANVSMDRLSAKLKSMGILTEKKILPKVLYLISEKILEDASPKAWWTGEVQPGGTVSEPPVIQALTNRGFDYFDPGTLNFQGQFGAQISDRQAQILGKQLGTDLVIIGTSVVGLAPNTMDGAIRSYLGNVDLHIISTNSGEVLARTSQSAISAGADPAAGQSSALTSASNKAAADLATQLAEAWLQRSGKKQQLEVMVSGIGGKIAQLVQFRRALGEIDGVKNLQMKEMTSFSATLEVDYKGSAQALAEGLMVKSFKNFGINIYQVDVKGIKVELVKNQ